MDNRYVLVSRRLHHLWMLWLTLLLCTNAVAQSTRFTIKGHVTDPEKQSLPGTTVAVVGTTLGTTTDADGDYTLTVTLKPGPVTLAFSAIGYETLRQSITLGNADQVTANAALAAATTNLDEVVVTGSTLSAPKRELGNAISTIKASDLQQSGSGNLINSLQGKVPGAQITQNSGDPAGGISIRLRGIKSLVGSSDPLYVVDGVIVSNASTNVSQLALANDAGNANVGQNRLSDINPDDIATLNVINGAAAAAQYGSRAANGVVIITTKRGQSGKAQVTFSTSFNINELRKGVPINTYGKQFGFASLRLYPIGVVSDAQVAANPGTTTTGIYRDGTTSQLATNLVDVQRYNYFDQIFRTGYGTDNNLSISGGRDNTQYYVSFGYLKNQGIIKDTDFTRYNLRARVDQRLTNWAKISVGLSYANSFSNEKANGNVFYSPINSVNITNNIYDITKRDAAGNLQAVEPTRVNPLSTIEDMKFSQSVSRTINSLQLNLTPLKGLSIDYIVGVDAYSQFGKNYIRPYPYQAVAGLPAARYPGGFAATATNQVLQFNNDLNAQYERQFSDKFKLNAAIGYSYQYYQADYSINSGQNLVPLIETVSGASNTTYQVRYDLDRFSLSGAFAQATLGFRNLAFITGAVRRDQSSKFSPTQTNQYYPKVSGSFIVSDLEFWKNLSFSNAFNSLKLRASYGEAGNLSGIGSYARFYQFSPVGFLGKNTVVPGTQLANPDVKPERMAEFEGGLDLAFLNGRIGLGVTAYQQKISDLVVNRTLAPTTGGTSIVNNVGAMENKGFEVVLDVNPIKTKNLNWDFTVIYNHNRNKVLDLGGQPIINPDASSASGTPGNLIVGQPVGVFYGTGYARNADGSLILSPSGFPQSERASSQDNGSISYVPARNSDGTLDVTKPLANLLIGNPNPKWTGSFSTNLAYKKLTLHVLLDMVQGVDVFNADKRTRQGVGLGDYAEQELRGTLKRGYIFGVYNTQEFRVDPGSYTKLREVSLSYTLPQFIKGLSRLTVSAVGRNLYSWDKYTGFDPETNAGGNNDLLRGIDFGNVPIPRTYQFKLAATF
ncbi:TonB-linked outer membrane protein, SusC/RagA family [Spirosoma endophyticum]|uniref:TonB-linked outer membrane protein, SusC/RagA family n=2 Tax=Spirosoma endophyticum TaxID=662367 RepID=A0A1I2C3W9_9BACT|nr:SusC/RagA family TonB-linked outer membrane protein [Spirosoma endophyticum]SFE62463.1 TonB-linked outer membrane protein, SusC/RagA family [Spirosoma endophyticum]